MLIRPTDSIDEMGVPATAPAVSSVGPSELECEVMNLFEEYRNPLLRYVLSFGLPVHDAEEVTQEVFVCLFRHLQLERSRQNVQGWIFRVAHNLTLKRRQANQKSRQTLASDWTIAERQPDPSPDPEEEVAFKQRQRRLLAVLHALPEEDQCCLRLRAEGLRYREIAAVLGISLGAVSICLTRSLARLMRADGSSS
jgi:RNA polymerase sigma-70 factor, ECF subfamily